jgi:hypothetical protein
MFNRDIKKDAAVQDIWTCRSVRRHPHPALNCFNWRREDPLTLRGTGTRPHRTISPEMPLWLEQANRWNHILKYCTGPNLPLRYLFQTDLCLHLSLPVYCVFKDAVGGFAMSSVKCVTSLTTRANNRSLLSMYVCRTFPRETAENYGNSVRSWDRNLKSRLKR